MSLARIISLLGKKINICSDAGSQSDCVYKGEARKMGSKEDF